jgi:hypothetical protein
MVSEKTHADSLWLYLTGAGADGGAQADPDLALGNFRSSTVVVLLSHTVTNPIANVTIDYIPGENGPGVGSVIATGNDTLAYEAPGGSQGANVTILNGETKILEDGTDANCYVRVSRTTAANLTGTATLTIIENLNNVIGFDNVTSAEASAGDDEYRIWCMKNVSSAAVENILVWIKTLGTQRISGTAQLPGAGAGTIQLATGNFDDWPDSGYCHIKDSGGSLREIVYYSSRTSTVLTVPALGRGLLGTSAAAGAATDTVDAVPGIRIAKEAPSAQPNGFCQTIANEDTAPAGPPAYVTGIQSADAVDIGDLAAGYIYFIIEHREIPGACIAEANVLNSLRMTFDAA